MANHIRMTLMTETDRTCSDRWHFLLEPIDGGDYRILAVEVESELGCQGHPRTIDALLRGRRVNDLDLPALDAAACTRDQSCAQTLATLLRELRRGLGVDD